MKALMGNFLMRNIPEELRRGLDLAAKASERSLSEAAKDMLRVGLKRTVQSVKPKMNAWQSIRCAIGENG
jgi:plasmid stability protein